MLWKAADRDYCTVENIGSDSKMEAGRMGENEKQFP